MRKQGAWVAALFLFLFLLQFGASFPSTVPAFLWSSNKNLYSGMKDTIDYRTISQKNLARMVLSDGGWSSLLCPGPNVQQAVDIGLVFVGREVQSSDIFKSHHADSALMNLLRVSFTRSNFSLAFPYVSPSEENQAMESSLISGFTESCVDGLAVNNVAYLESCSVDGGDFLKLADLHAVHDYMASVMKNKQKAQKNLIVLCSEGTGTSEGLDKHLSEGESFSELISSVEKSGISYSVLYASDPRRSVQYPSYRALDRFLAEGTAGNGSVNGSAFCDGVCQIKSSLLEGLLVAIVLLVILISGLCCMMGIDTPTRESQKDDELSKVSIAAFTVPKTPLNPNPTSPLSSLQSISPNKLFPLSLKLPLPLRITQIQSYYYYGNPNFPLSLFSTKRRSPVVSAGRSKKTNPSGGGGSGGRIEGGSDIRREAKRNARRRSLKLAESLFYRLKNPNRNHADNFTEDELQMIGLGYDRMVRFMDKDDPNLRHPFDWYKYGEFGPYSWRGIVIGDPIRGRFSDERVSMIGEVRDHQEWEQIEQYEMAQDFGNILNTSMDKSLGFKHFWVFVRHPRWRLTELPWQQWTLVSEVVVQAAKHNRLDKWNLMARLGNKVRASITQCSAWMRPDIIYVKRPVYQCRFEPQDDFFKALGPLLDPTTEHNFLFELKREDGSFETCTYFGGLCKIVKANPKSFVDDVVKAYDKLNDENKSKCLEFLLTNHPIELLHPYTKEWKAKLEEMELGCDAPDDEDEDHNVEWIEEDDDEEDSDNDNESDEDEDEDVVMDIESGDDELGMMEENEGPEESEKYWEEEFEKAIRSSEAMESLVKRSVEASTKLYKKQIRTMDDAEQKGEEDGMRMRPKVYKDEWDYVGYGRNRRRKVKKNRIPAELYLRAAVRPFTYKNLVKEIVLMRHGIIDGDISGK
ncbi:2-C-methyl-D-erythritol 4-phosphate cytidylyltransferase [Thalictrum thalictroides]|uniref:2-C-methyl-D-erythritol 4-phosphate cytidylyltransferase n=1 Tax=Thalictrum thalictroides TaxID=46969 RepID=A0A7J6V8P9_THATH|nr:2-C-methyl-D-erythritol 4-phosphate cytidylyltransferase [Thalictrum thalictroides]